MSETQFYILLSCVFLSRSLPSGLAFFMAMICLGVAIYGND